MRLFRIILILLICTVYGSNRQYRLANRPFSLSTPYSNGYAGRGALLLSRFDSYEAFQAVVSIDYYGVSDTSTSAAPRDCMVRLIHTCGNRSVTSTLTDGVSQRDFQTAQAGGFWDKVALVAQSPNILLDKRHLEQVNVLARWRSDLFGEGDVAFYDLAEAMMYQISTYDRGKMTLKDLSEKGYINTFNHITAQAFMTSIFSERLAAFIAEAHERYNMPELITGHFSSQQLADLEYGPTDNYIDMINNEWGQELGKELKEKYAIDQHTRWTPSLLVSYLNDVQRYFGWSFQIGFVPFREGDETVIKFSRKLNRVLHSGMKFK